MTLARLPILVLTCDKYDFLLPGFAYLFNKYWPVPTPVTVGGFRTPPALPDNFEFLQVAPVENEAWSDHMRKYAAKLPEYFLWLLDDYWLYEPVEACKVELLLNTFLQRKSAKADLSLNTYSFGSAAVPGLPGFIVANQDSRYRTSTQPAIWTREYLLRYTKPGRRIWDFEKLGTGEARHDGAEILACDMTLAPAYPYANIYKKGRPAPQHIQRLHADDVVELKRLGYEQLFNISQTRVPRL